MHAALRPCPLTFAGPALDAFEMANGNRKMRSATVSTRPN